MKFLMTLLLLGSLGHASTKITLQGKLMGFDKSKKIVKIETGKNKVVKVPLKSITTPLEGYIVGKAVVRARVRIADMVRLNGKVK